MLEQDEVEGIKSKNVYFFSFLVAFFIFILWTARIFLSKASKNQRNKFNFSEIAISLLKICMILTFPIIYPINTSLIFFEHIERK